MAADVSTKSHATTSDRPTDLEIPDPLPAIEGAVSPERDDKYQGPHAWRKSLRPVQSPIKFDCLLDGPDDKQSKPRQLPPWKRDLIEHNKKVARLVRRESSGRSKRTAIVRRESSGRAKRPPGSESPSGLGRKKSFRNENPFTQQVVNEAGQRRRVSPANSFKREGCIRRTPSDKAFDPNDPATKKRLERVRRSRLYLLQQMGPNSFQIVGDSPDHKFKVIIGPQTCTCGKVPHCVHVLFVMLRVFQIKETDSCLWSKQLKNYEVENLFRVYNDKRTLRIEAKARRRNQRPSPDTSQSPSPETSVVPSESDAGSIREEDETCPICLLDMLEGESLQKCGECQNKLHHHCITVWFEECKRQSDPLICPLCRARWKNTSNEIKQEDPTPTVVEFVPHVPSSPRAPSPHDLDRSRLPYAEPIPGDYINVAAPWIEILGEDLVSCLFSRNWSIRETGLKHLAKEMSREMVKVSGESRSGAGGMTMANTATMLKLLECSFGVVAYMCNDPVYKVFVGCLKVLRSVLCVTPSRDNQQKAKLQSLFKPVMDSIIVKCTDGNRKTSDLSVSTIVELAKGQHGELSLGKELNNPGTHGLGGMVYVVKCLTEKYDQSDITWQWLLGRLYVIEKLVMEFPTEFLPRQRPDGASSESSLELIGAASSALDEERPQNYDRLLTVAEFAINAVANSHLRISRVAKRVFLLSAKYAVHLSNMISEFKALLNKLEFSHKKSLQRQLDKITSDFQLADELGKQLRDQLSPPDTPETSPVSTPRCSSPVTTVSNTHSDKDIKDNAKTHPSAPPNTPIHERKKKHLTSMKYNKSFDAFEECAEVQAALKTSRSLDDLDPHCKPRSRKSQSPVMRKSKSRSRSNTPKRVGPVLETNLDEVIKMQEEARQIGSNNASYTDSVFTELIDCNEDDLSLTLIQSNEEILDLPAPSPRLLSNDLETDIDSVEPDLDLMLKVKVGNLTSLGDNALVACVTPKMEKEVKQKPKSLSLDFDSKSRIERSRRAISPCAHAKEFERLSVLGSVSPAPCLNSLSQTNSAFSKEAYSTTKQKTYSTASTVGVERCEVIDKTGHVASQRRQSDASGRADMTDDLTDYRSPIGKNEKPVTFVSEVASATPKHSPSHTLDKDDEDCICKEEVEREEAIALARAMEVSSKDGPKPVVPGLTPMDQEEVITIRIQPDECDGLDAYGSPPTLYYENVHWKKGHLLGTGAFSTCYQCRDVKTGTIMALKQISFCRNSKTEQEKVIETITEEIHMMAKLNHPHIVRILGATRQGCHFNMFVEWMPGGSVSFLLGQYGCFAEEVITNYILQVLRGLAYLHENHILHRDLKGANLLVDSTGQRLRIGDFGAAARLASKATGAGEFQGQLLGTIAFMAPEVLRGENYGRACDVWSVGCCLIEMATTKPPWNAHDISNHLALIFKIANSQSSPPIPEKLTPPLRDLLLRCLEPLKEQRPTAKELLIHPLFTQYMKK